MPYTTYEKLAEVVREIRYREKVYGRLLGTGGMSEWDVNRRIGTMREIAQDYADLLKRERQMRGRDGENPVLTPSTEADRVDRAKTENA